MTYVKTYLPTLKTHGVNLKREEKDLSRDLQRLEVRGKLVSKTLYWAKPLAKDAKSPLLFDVRRSKTLLLKRQR